MKRIQIIAEYDGYIYDANSGEWFKPDNFSSILPQYRTDLNVLHPLAMRCISDLCKIKEVITPKGIRHADNIFAVSDKINAIKEACYSPFVNNEKNTLLDCVVEGVVFCQKMRDEYQNEIPNFIS